MKKYFILCFSFIFLLRTTNAQTITQLISTADTLLKNESFDESLNVRNKILFKIGNKPKELFYQQKYKQLLTQALIQESPTSAIATAKNAQVYFNRLKNKPIDEQIRLYKVLYQAYSSNEQNEDALNVALFSLQKVNKIKGYNSKNRIDLIYDIGYLYELIENYYEAINYYKQSLALYIKNVGEVNEDIALNYNNLAFAYNSVYNQKYTIAYYNKAASIWEKVYSKKPDVKDNLILVYQNLIAVLLSYGDLEEAKTINHKLNKSFFKKYHTKASRELPTYFESRKLMVMGNIRVLSASGKFNAAMKYCDSLRAETKFTIDNKKDIAFLVNCYTFISDYTYDINNYEQTLKLSKLAALDADKFNLTRQKMIINAKLGTTYEKLKDFKKALYHINIADENANKQSFNSSKFSIQMIKSQILQGQGLDQQALNLTRSVISQITFEKTAKKIALSKLNIVEIKEIASEGFINIFVVAGHISLNSYQKTKKNNELADAQKLFVLAAQLFQEYYLKGEYNETLAYYHKRIVEGLLTCVTLKTVSNTEKIEMINLIERIASQHLIKEYDKKINRSITGISIYVNQINELKTELAYYKSVKSDDLTINNFNNSKIISIAAKIKELTQKIASTEKNYIAFNNDNFNLNDVQQSLKDNTQILKYYVTDHAIFSVLIDRNAIELKAIKLSPSLQTQIESFLEQTKLISSDFKINAGYLYQMLLPKNLKEHIVIIPDNFLNYVPFETLYNQHTKQFVVQQNVIAYDYSLPLFLMHQKSSKTYFTPSLAAFSPNYSGEPNLVRDAGFKNLKFAGIEAGTIAKLFDGDLFEGKNATKNIFIDKMSKYGIFHLSMHSQLYEDDFNQSFLLFANNQKLFFSELYGMNIPANMVVLSACNTGNGLLRKGEGIMSMSRALTYAGVKSAVVSLWQVPDKETAEIMVTFYQNLKDGQNKATALANAKSKFINDNPMKNHPFFWAGFIVNGDTSPIYQTNIWWYIGIGFLTLLLLSRFIFRKKLVKVSQ